MFDEELFQKALDQPRLQGHVPTYLKSNRAEPIRVLKEPELQAMTKQWFVDFESKLDHYSKHFQTDLSWVMTWAKKYWWSFLVRDMDLNHELYAPDIKYTDVSTFGHTIRGIDEFVTYNFAFFEAIPDWRYDPLPDQVYLDVKPDGTVRTMIRYIGSGHWTGALRLHPFDDSAPRVYGTGQFIQCPAVDRYHFNKDGLMEEGETLYDIVDGLQRGGILPGGDSRLLRGLFGLSKVPATASRLTRGVTTLLGRR
ncbi:nuclear transport factor 2 family protein [Mycobacterium sp. DBP42]|uniref:nuclear transport factor 2 family protein n=1 Tax=Mycobacterium sp. DBP42 TaxID=2545267 RepID=UPI00110CDBD4|nr:nuclear transport factor 2 family protein [Mycobacterium sp. DBP42]TMS46538.1 nuclear transport factor 2 family protein [Mycobacterium sp. DBP42]